MSFTLNSRQGYSGHVIIRSSQTPTSANCPRPVYYTIQMFGSKYPVCDLSCYDSSGNLLSFSSLHPINQDIITYEIDQMDEEYFEYLQNKKSVNNR